MFIVTNKQRRDFDRLSVSVRKGIVKDFGSVASAYEAGMIVRGRRAILPSIEGVNTHRRPVRDVVSFVSDGDALDRDLRAVEAAMAATGMSRY